MQLYSATMNSRHWLDLKSLHIRHVLRKGWSTVLVCNSGRKCLYCDQQRILLQDSPASHRVHSFKHSHSSQWQGLSKNNHLSRSVCCDITTLRSISVRPRVQCQSIGLYCGHMYRHEESGSSFADSSTYWLPNLIGTPMYQLSDSSRNV